MGTTTPPFCYLDNAATSWPKPPAVMAAMNSFYTDLGVAAERSGSARAGTVDRAIQKCRHQIAAMLSAGQESSIVFGYNGTDVLNLALHGLLNRGDHVVASVAEHNSVLRPLEYLQQHSGITYSLAEADGHGVVCPEAVEQLVQSSTRLVCLAHVSNVTGAVQPVLEVGRICREHELLYLVDAAQSVGHFPIDVGEIGCDLLASSGHKGLLGPLGTGFLYLGGRIAPLIRPMRQGGTGTQSETMEHPNELPARLETGNLNSAGIIGLSAGVEHVANLGWQEIANHEREMSHQLIQGLSEIDQVRLVGHRAPQRSGIVSFQVEGMDPGQVAGILDVSFGILVRSGLHCAPRMHASLGTLDGGGTVRVSPGMFNTAQDVQNMISAIQQITVSATYGN
ncbi:MAG: aminotransferase class V-fold PLP-dependent enzyme [Mariniblastus sp.]|nr:aminotransferase class V-fold PLP-dependent enzyme [Mariniblastus sp.]